MRVFARAFFDDSAGLADFFFAIAFDLDFAAVVAFDFRGTDFLVIAALTLGFAFAAVLVFFIFAVFLFFVAFFTGGS